jgi:hypothetical protein
MAQRDGKSELQLVHLGNLTLSGTTPAASAWVDTRGFDKVTLVPVANTIADAGTASGFSFEVQESNTTAAADATAVADAELNGAESDLTVTSDDADNTVIGGIGYVGSKRYVRLVATGTTGTNADVSVIAVNGDATIEPPTFVGTSVAAT